MNEQINFDEWPEGYYSYGEIVKKGDVVEVNATQFDGSTKIIYFPKDQVWDSGGQFKLEQAFNFTKHTPFRTDLQKELNFTKEQGIAVQTEQLNRLKAVLNPEAWLLLRLNVIAKNDEAYDGFDICRGDKIDEILHNVVVPQFYKE